MKKIFKKNQVIITALALMLCAAGYLQFSDAGRDAGDETENSGYELNVSDNEGTGEKGMSEDGVTINVGNMEDSAAEVSDDGNETADIRDSATDGEKQLW